MEELTHVVRAGKGLPLQDGVATRRVEKAVKEQAGATSRNIPFDPPETLFDLCFLREIGCTFRMVCQSVLTDNMEG